jgi:hypothetical protein
MTRLYRVIIAEYPDNAWRLTSDSGDGYRECELDPDFRPVGWLADPEARAAWVDRHGDDRFYWPSTGRIFRSRSSAKRLADLIESYGATAVILEADPAWEPIPEANRRRKRARNAKRIAALQAEITRLSEAS